MGCLLVASPVKRRPASQWTCWGLLSLVRNHLPPFILSSHFSHLHTQMTAPKLRFQSFAAIDYFHSVAASLPQNDLHVSLAPFRALRMIAPSFHRTLSVSRRITKLDREGKALFLTIDGNVVTPHRTCPEVRGSQYPSGASIFTRLEASSGIPQTVESVGA